MKKTNMQWGVIATATVAIVGALASPQALAKTKAKAPANEGYAAAPSANSRVDALEAQLQAMQAELSSLRAAQNRPSTESAKVQELDEWSKSITAKQAKLENKDNMVFFRGGYGRANQSRGGTLDPTYVAGLGSNRDGLTTGDIGDQDSWYFGAGFDFSLNDNLFGLMNGTEVLAELMFDYKELGQKASNGLSAQETAVLRSLDINLPAANSQSATVSQFSLAASPKIKFFKGSAFRPWLIPVGFEISVISPPSDAITVLNPGMVFGAGADYKIWKDLYVGADARYHYSADNVDGVSTDGVTAGGYLGIGF